MAVYQIRGNIRDYCHNIIELCRTELDSKLFSKKLIEILENLNQIKQESKLKFSIYILEKSDEE